MLTRIENIYLGTLRVVVLVIATIALAVATFSSLKALPGLARWVGVAPAPVIQGGTLSEYVAEKKESVPAKPGVATADPTTDIPADADTEASARTLQSYTKAIGGMTIPRWRSELQDMAYRGVPSAHLEAYRRDLHALTDQLGKSTGRKLTLEQVRELLTWNLAQFAADAQAQDAKALTETARAANTLYVAVAAFLLFMLVVFAFLFVKIERSLRLVRTTRLEVTDV